MASAITDLVDRVSDSSTGRPIIATLAAPGKAIAAGSINVAAATNWTTTTAIHFSIYETTTVGSTVIKNATTQTDWKGTLSGTAISNLTITGGTDRAYTAGAIVELTPTARYAKDLYDWAMTHANQDGTLKTTAVTTALTAGTITNSMLAAGSAVTNAKLSTTAGELGGAWQAWTPTFTNWTIGTGGNAGTSAYYMQIGKTVFFRIRSSLGTSGQSVSGAVSFSLPTAMNAELYNSITEGYYLGEAKFLDAGLLAVHGRIQANTSTTASLNAMNTAATYASSATVNATQPFTWGAGDMFMAEGFYEAA